MRLLHSLLVLSLLPAWAAEHRALVPRPQEIRYAGGTLALDGLSIRFASEPGAEDRFAARQLSAGLSAAGQTLVPVHETGNATPAIVLVRTGDVAALPAADEQAGPDSREAYTLRVSPSGAEIRARASAGLFYGVQTLLQMVEGSGSRAVLPAAEVRDWPALAYRGFMMDLSHGQLLHLEEIERQIDLLARFKANQYFFYSEAAIELEGYSLVNPDGRYTREQVRRIIAYARERHVDVVPCLELYGHMHDLFRVEKFADLSLPRYGGEFDPRNPRIREVLDGLVEQTAKLFPSPWYHVGFDEPWALGKLGVAPGADPFQLYLDTLRHVAGEAQKYHKRLMFWADMLSGARIFSRHPELIAGLPKGSIAVPWVYNDRPDFTPYVEPLAKMNVPTVVAPGVWNWNEVFPDYHQTFKNINGLLATGKRYHTLGILNTGWTDSAQTLYRMSLPGLALGAAAGWQSAPVDAAAYFRDYCGQTYPAAVAAEVAPALEELSSAEETFTKVLQGASIHRFWADPLDPARLPRLEAHREDLHRARLLAESAQERLQRALRMGGDPRTLESLLIAARMFDYLGMKNLYAVEWAGYFGQLRENPDPELVNFYLNTQIAAQDHGMLADLMDAVTGLREQYRQAWLEESTPYRLGTALARWDAEAEYWRAIQVQVPRISRGHKKGEPFPPVDALRPQR
ncbi:MAG TPA: beta-N-acetylhexosaminidase [Bryobacteraceae bacterium]|nr:beta-N-acetylhexosaminidase [Bryobacteraceae bacterium]